MTSLIKYEGGYFDELKRLLTDGVEKDLQILCKDGRLDCDQVMFVVGGPWWSQAFNQSQDSHTVLMLDFAKEEVQGAITFLYTGYFEGDGLDDVISVLNILFPDVLKQVEKFKVEKKCFNPTLDDETWDRQMEFGLSEEVVEMVEADPVRSGNQCTRCDKQFKYPKDLRNHMLVHENRTPLRCSLCNRPSRTLSNMYQHLRSNHLILENLKSYILDEHGETIADRDKKQQKDQEKKEREQKNALHINYVKSLGPVALNERGVSVYQCPVCQRRVVASSLKNHLNTHDPSKFTHQCTFCPNVYCTNSSLTFHLKNSHNKTKDRFVCVLCSMTFATLALKLEHQKECRSKTSSLVTCELCSKQLSCKTSLALHKRNVHGARLGRPLETLRCKICNKYLVGKRKLFRHISEVHNVNPTCDQCDKVLTDCDAMMKHIKCHTMAAVIRPSCARCFRKFKRDKNEQSDVCRNCLKQNQKHIAQKSLNLEPVITNDVSVKLQLKCDKCHEEFVDKNGLKKHMKYKHRKERTGGEMYRCQHCLLENKQKNVNSISFFRRHLQLHKCETVMNPTTSTVYRCGVCARDPVTADKLNLHIKQWLNKKIYECNICSKTSATSQALSYHVLTHTGQKPFHCTLCGERFTQLGSLNTHYARHKSGSLDPQNHRCAVCSKQCKNLAGLKKHLLSHDNPNKRARVPGIDGGPPPLLDRVDLGPSLPLDTDGGPSLHMDSSLSGLLKLDNSNSSFFDQFQVTTISLEGLEQDCYRNEGLPFYQSKDPAEGMAYSFKDAAGGIGYQPKEGNVAGPTKDGGSPTFTLTDGVTYTVKDVEGLSFVVKDPAQGPTFQTKDADMISYELKDPVSYLPKVTTVTDADAYYPPGGKDQGPYNADGSVGPFQSVSMAEPSFMQPRAAPVHQLLDQMSEDPVSYFLPRVEAGPMPRVEVGPLPGVEVGPLPGVEVGPLVGGGREEVFTVHGNDGQYYKIQVIAQDQANL